MVGRVFGVWGCGCQRECNCDSERRGKNMDMPAIRCPSGIINLPGFSGDDDQHKQSISIPSRWSHISAKLLRYKDYKLLYRITALKQKFIDFYNTIL